MSRNNTLVHCTDNVAKMRINVIPAVADISIPFGFGRNIREKTASMAFETMKQLNPLSQDKRSNLMEQLLNAMDNMEDKKVVKGKLTRNWKWSKNVLCL